MKVFDSVNKTEVEVDGTKGLIQLMKDGRQVDLHLKEKKSDEDGYMSWDVEHWSSVDGKRFIRCYSLEGRVLSESTGHNIYDLANDFKPFPITVKDCPRQIPHQSFFLYPQPDGNEIGFIGHLVIKYPIKQIRQQMFPNLQIDFIKCFLIIDDCISSLL